MAPWARCLPSRLLALLLTLGAIVFYGEGMNERRTAVIAWSLTGMLIALNAFGLIGMLP